MTIIVESLIIFLYSIFLLNAFKREVIKIRRGRGRLLNKAESFYSIKFFPYYVGNVLIAFYVLTFVCMFVFTTLFLPDFWKLMKTYIHLATALLIDVVVLYIFKCFTMDHNLIKRRRLLIVIEFFYFITGIAG